MQLNVTSEHGGEQHRGPVFPDAAERDFAYQSESVRIEAVFHASPPHRGDGKLNRDLPPSPYSEYELRITRATGKAFSFMLVGKRKDIVEQRQAKGCAVEEDVLLTTLDFGELCNRIFGSGAQVFHHTEAFPDSVKEAMRQAYPTADRPHPGG